jgi:hypothetical protein
MSLYYTPKYYAYAYAYDTLNTLEAIFKPYTLAITKTLTSLITLLDSTRSNTYSLRLYNTIL